MYDDIAVLSYSVYENEEIIEKTQEIYVKKKSVRGSEFYTAYQSGINVTCVFETRKEDFELTKHIDPETKKALYATNIIYEGANYNIVRTFETGENVEITCS